MMKTATATTILPEGPTGLKEIRCVMRQSLSSIITHREVQYRVSAQSFTTMLLWIKWYKADLTRHDKHFKDDSSLGYSHPAPSREPHLYGYPYCSKSHRGMETHKLLQNKCMLIPFMAGTAHKTVHEYTGFYNYFSFIAHLL